MLSVLAMRSAFIKHVALALGKHVLRRSVIIHTPLTFLTLPIPKGWKDWTEGSKKSRKSSLFGFGLKI